MNGLDKGSNAVHVVREFYLITILWHQQMGMGTSKLSGKPDEMLGGYLGWISIPSRRGSNTPSRFMLRTPG